MAEISIIVPVYNVEQYLNRCIISILNQTFTDFELILVDDGSPDNCPIMCDEWAKRDNRIKVIHKENGGLSSARNAGLKVASGNYVGFVDSDDWIDKNMYEELYRLSVHYSADIVCGGIIRTSLEENKVINDEDKIMVFTQQEFAKKYFKVDSKETVHYMCNKLYTSEVSQKIEFPVGLINEDVEGFFEALACSKRIVTTSRLVYYYWINPESISSKWFSYKQMDLLKVWENVMSRCINFQQDEWVYYAKMNYYRAHFGLLCRLMLSDDKTNRKYINEKKYLLNCLKEHYVELIHFSIPLNRKILMTMMCVNYGLTRCIFRMVGEIKGIC